MDNKDIRDAGLKVTTPRVKILAILESADPHHLSAEDVYNALRAQGEEIALATVYRVLTQFEAANLVTRHNFEGGFSVFELEKGDHHDHLVCVKCGAVKEFMDDEIEKRQEIIAKQAGFTVTDHNHTIYGLCKKCR